MPDARTDDGRKLYDAHAWVAALEAFAHADRETPLPSADLMPFGFCAFLLGHEEQSIDLLGRAFRGFLGAGDRAAAARAAFWLAFVHESHGDPARAAELDDAMAVVTSGEVQTPIVIGAAYCSVISASLRTADVARAREWTTAASDWCSRNPELVPFRGECLRVR